MPITLSAFPLSFWQTFSNLTHIILYLNCSITSAPCGMKLFEKPRITAHHILVLYTFLEQFSIILLLYTKALMLPQQCSLKTLISLTLFSMNHHCIHCATSLVIAHTQHITFTMCQWLRLFPLLPPFNFLLVSPIMILF